MFGAQDFWNRKKHDEWSSQEIRQLTTRSPWAKDVRVELKTAARGGYDGGPGIPDDPTHPGSPSGTPNSRMPGADSPGMGRGGPELPGEIGDARRGTGGMIPTEALSATVRWESAQPIVDALRTPFPPEFADHYVIGISGLAVLQGRDFGLGNEDMVGRLKASATLQAKGKTSYQPGVLRRSAAGMWFGFAKESMPLTAADRDLTFALNTGQLDLKAKFEPKEMLYLGKLAV